MFEYRIVKYRGRYQVETRSTLRSFFDFLFGRKPWFSCGDEYRGITEPFNFDTVDAAKKYIAKEEKYQRENFEVVG